MPPSKKKGGGGGIYYFKIKLIAFIILFDATNPLKIVNVHQKEEDFTIGGCSFVLL